MTSFRFYRMWTVASKEFIHIKRDIPSLIISFMMPMVMLMIFGLAVKNDVTNVEFAVYDGDQTTRSRDLIAAFVNTDYFDEVHRGYSVVDIEEEIKHGNVKVGLIVPPGYDRAIGRKERPSIQLLIDGSDPTIARTTMLYATAITNNFNTRLMSGATMSGLSANPMVLYNPSLESTKFNVPGVVGLILQNITIVLTALAMVREKELGTMEQLIMTPVTSVELILGKLVPYVCIGIYDFLVVILLSKLVFNVDVAGSFLELSLLGIIFMVGALAMGMLISTFSSNQGQAILGTMAFLLPSVLLSGFMFPRESMPIMIQVFSATLPITHFLVILRGIMIKGVDLTYLWSSTIAMLIIIIGLIVVTTFKFKKKLD